MVWYQKEYSAGKLHEAFADVGVILGNELFNCLDFFPQSNDSGVFLFVLKRLSVSAANSSPAFPDKLTVETNKFTWKHSEGTAEEYCLCRKTADGWLFEIGSDIRDASIAINFGWQRLSWEHPLAHTTITAGPSRHLNLCRND